MLVAYERIQDPDIMELTGEQREYLNIGAAFLNMFGDLAAGVPTKENGSGLATWFQAFRGPFTFASDCRSAQCWTVPLC